MPEQAPAAALALLVALVLLVRVRSFGVRTRRPSTRARTRTLAEEQQAVRNTVKLRIWQGVMRGELSSARGVPDSAPGQPVGHAAPTGATVGSDNTVVNVDDQVRTVREGTPTSTWTNLNTDSVVDERHLVYQRVQVIDGWRRWRGSVDEDGYPRVWLSGRGYEKAHRLVYAWEQGPIPFGWTVDHHCGEKDCLDHLEAVTVGTNTSRRHARERGELPTGHAGLVPPVREGAPQPAAGVTSVQTEPRPASTIPAPADAVTGAPMEPAPAVSSRRGLDVEQRRAEVQRLRAQGWSLRRIAEQLGISLGTVHADAAAGVQPGVQGVQLERPAEHPHATPHDAVADFKADTAGTVGRDAGEPASEPPDNVIVNPSGGTAGVQIPIALFERYDRPAVEQRTVDLEELVDLLTTFDELADKRQARCWSPTLYAAGATSRANAGVEAVSCLVFDCDRVEPDWARLEGYWYVAHTTYQHTPEHPRWRLVLPLAAPVPAQQWPAIWRRAHGALCPEADPNCKDPSRQYYLPSRPPGVMPEARCHEGRLLDPTTLPELPPEPEPRGVRHLIPPAVLREPTTGERRRGEAVMTKVIDDLARVPAGGRNAALNKTAWKLGQWVAAGALDQGTVEDALYDAAERNGLVADDGARQCWATIRSGLGAGLLRPIDLAADNQPPGWRRRGTRRRSHRRT